MRSTFFDRQNYIDGTSAITVGYSGYGRDVEFPFRLWGDCVAAFGKLRKALAPQSEPYISKWDSPLASPPLRHDFSVDGWVAPSVIASAVDSQHWYASAGAVQAVTDFLKGAEGERYVIGGVSVGMGAQNRHWFYAPFTGCRDFPELKALTGDSQQEVAQGEK